MTFIIKRDIKVKNNLNKIHMKTMKKNLILLSVKKVLLFALPAFFYGTTSSEGQTMTALTVNTDVETSAMGNIAGLKSSNARYMLFTDNESVIMGNITSLHNMSGGNLGEVKAVHNYHQNDAIEMDVIMVNFNPTSLKGSVPQSGLAPSETAAMMGYSKRFQNVSVGVSSKIDNSILWTPDRSISYAGVGVAFDFSVFYHQPGKDGFVMGAELKNIGATFKYKNSEQSPQHMPATVSFESGYTKIFTNSNRFMFEVDLVDPLVSNKIFDDLPKVSSFAHAAGDLMINVGSEYYIKTSKSTGVSLRAGYCSESDNIAYNGFTTGVGLRIQSFNLNVAYTVPTDPGAYNPVGHALQLGVTHRFLSK